MRIRNRPERTRQGVNRRVQCVSLILCFSFTSVAVAEEFQYPLAVAADNAGTLYVADRNLPGVWKIAGKEPELYFQGSKKFRTPLNAPRCIFVDQKGRILAGDSSTREVYRFDHQGKPQPLTEAGIGIPMGIGTDRDGNIFISDLETHRIYKVAEGGGKPAVFAEVAAPHGITVDAQNQLWVVSHGKNQLVRIAADGQVETAVEGRPFQFPHEVVVDKNGAAYVSDGYAKAIWKIAAGKKPVQWVSGKPLLNPVGITWRGEQLIVVDPHARSLFKVDPSGKLSALNDTP